MQRLLEKVRSLYTIQIDVREVITRKISFSGELWLYSGPAAWHFVTLGKEVSNKIRTFVKGDTSAWGSVKVAVRVKTYTWETSVFPDRKLACYLLPIKKSVRKELHLTAGLRVKGVLQIQRDLGFLAFKAR